MTVTSFKKGETRATSGEMFPQLIRFISNRDGYFKKEHPVESVKCFNRLRNTLEKLLHATVQGVLPLLAQDI